MNKLAYFLSDDMRKFADTPWTMTDDIREGVDRFGNAATTFAGRVGDRIGSALFGSPGDYESNLSPEGRIGLGGAALGLGAVSGTAGISLLGEFLRNRQAARAAARAEALAPKALSFGERALGGISKFRALLGR